MHTKGKVKTLLKSHIKTNSIKGWLLFLSPTDQSFHRARLARGTWAFPRPVSVFSPQYEVAIATEKGVEVEGPLTLEANWDIAHLVR